MNTLIVYASYHHKNTEKVALAMADTLNAKMMDFKEVKEKDIKEADLIGFGSGVYLSKFHGGLVEVIDNLPKMDGKKVFVFSTSGMRKSLFLNRAHEHIKGKLKSKGFTIIGEFDCRGFDTFSILKLFGGVNRGKPNEEDLERARIFASRLMEKERTDRVGS